MSQRKVELASKFNPIWKGVAKSLTSNCDKCGQPRLYSMFDAYITGDTPECLGCYAAYKLTRPLIGHVFNRTKLGEEDLKKLMSDTLIRKSMLNVVRGISHFGLRTPQPTAVPVVIVWNYTNQCNLDCLHCHQDSGETDDLELTSKEKIEVVDIIGEAGVSILTFSGGEPLVCSDIFKTIKHAHDTGLLCTVASNGTLITKHVAKRLKKAGVSRIEIGLDGYQAETHDFLRNEPGSFNATIQGIKNCAEEGFDELCVTMTLYEKNVKEVKGTLQLAENLGAGRFYLNRLIPAGRGANIIDLDVTNQQKIDALRTIYEKFHESVVLGKGIQCYSRGMTYYGRLGYQLSEGKIFTVSEAFSGHSSMWREKFGDGVSEIVRKFASGFGGCSAGVTYAGLTTSGDLLPCVPAPIKIGNLLEEDLENLWVNDDLLNYIRRRNELKGACSKCTYNQICGGCRYTAYVINGDWLAADPSCPLGPCYSPVAN